MKYLIGAVIGAFMFASLYYHIPRRLPIWFSRGDSDMLPDDYEGPRFRTWHNGSEVK